MDEYVELLLRDDSPEAAEPATRTTQQWMRLRLDVFAAEPRPRLGTDNPMTLEFLRLHEALVKKLRPFVEIADA